VSAALRERERLLELAPHLIRPLEFVLPQTDSPRPAWIIRIGLALYDRLGGRTLLPRSSSVRFAGSRYAAGLEAHVDRGFAYSDCCVDDSRLVIANVIDAAERGADIRTRTRFVHATRDARGWRCTLLDSASRAATTVSARALVNATGPWVTEVLANRVSVQRSKSVRLVKGSHIVVPRLYAGEHAFMLQNPDRRIVFVIPYEHDYSLVGTTEVSIDGPGAAPPVSADEAEYLCASANRYFTRKLTQADIVWSFSGTRPLFEDAAKDASAVTRDYVLDIDASRTLAPLLSVFGGKITTYRKLAEQALDKLSKYFPEASGSWTQRTPLPGGDIDAECFDAFVASLQRRYSFLPEPLTLRLARAYGSRVSTLLDEARVLEHLGHDFGAGLFQAEVDHLIEREWARTAEDVILRRSKLILHLPPSGIAQLRDYLEQRCGARSAPQVPKSKAS
jgi:glycerol-3-phosphate dehydrogenase